MKKIFEQQKTAFTQNPYPAIEQRKQQLRQLKAILLDNQQAICDAISKDFGYRNHNETLFAELMTCVGEINFTLGELRRWMKPEKRRVALQYQPASNVIQYQPLGVVGIIVAWNYPLYLAIGPLIVNLAAGNRAMLKMSEFTPALNGLLKTLMGQCFSEQQVAVIEGEAEVGAEFSRLPFDHLMFTGSTAVGKHVMRAAAENLTPVTLELGGKSPVFIDDQMAMSTVAQRILFGKSINAGQTCVAPDYLLCPKAKIDELVEAIKKQFAQLYPDFANNEDYTHIVNDRQYQRLLSWLDGAKQGGADVISAAPDYAIDQQTRKLPLQLVLNANPDSELLQQEIFGPILPIIGYETVDEAIRYVQDRPRPLALYIMSFDKQWQQNILTHTHSGGVTINDTVIHFGQKDMPIGGIGPSGMGHYHGIEGFKTFSKARGIHAKGRFDAVRFIHPPYHKSLLKWVLKLFMR
ncbi:MAG: coniferyl-aldehyde dehydrogenase [Phenylobacterium sp.]|jgi:coniferyl-aldehyde dehydrogenase